MHNLSRLQKAQIRELAIEAHERELSDALLALYERFQQWGGDEISAFDLQQLIHEFHDGISRTLYKRYTMGPPELAVIYAINHGVLSPDQIPAGIAVALGISHESRSWGVNDAV